MSLVKNAKRVYSKKCDVIEAAAKKTPENVRPYMLQAVPLFAAMSTMVELSLPLMDVIYKYLMKVYAFLEPYHPEDMAAVAYGLFMAFFGGQFPAVLTAVEAYRQMGFEPTRNAVKVLYDDISRVQAASKADDKKDEDKDGVPDVEQIQSDELVERKLLLFLKTTDPKSVSNALGALAAGWVSVIAALKVKFARAVTLGAAIGDVLRKPAQRYLGPLLKKFIPEDYHKWILPGLDFACKFISVSLAWALQSVVSAFYSAIRGGAIAAKGLLYYLNKHNIIAIKDQDTYLDELVGYIIAICGFLLQFTTGFSLPFPLSLLLFPLRVIEFTLVWAVMD